MLQPRPLARDQRSRLAKKRAQKVFKGEEQQLSSKTLIQEILMAPITIWMMRRIIRWKYQEARRTQSISRAIHQRAPTTPPLIRFWQIPSVVLLQCLSPQIITTNLRKLRLYKPKIKLLPPKTLNSGWMLPSMTFLKVLTISIRCQLRRMLPQMQTKQSRGRNPRLQKWASNHTMVWVKFRLGAAEFL